MIWMFHKSNHHTVSHRLLLQFGRQEMAYSSIHWVRLKLGSFLLSRTSVSISTKAWSLRQVGARFELRSSGDQSGAMWPPEEWRAFCVCRFWGSFSASAVIPVPASILGAETRHSAVLYPFVRLFLPALGCKFIVSYRAGLPKECGIVVCM